MGTHKNNQISAVVVLFNPDLNLIDKYFKNTLKQVDRIFVIDNTPSPLPGISSQLKKIGKKLDYQALGDNLGIAKAQNLGIRKALAKGCTHILLLDQDSVIPSDLVHKLIKSEEKLLQAGVQVAAVGPAFIHEKTKVIQKAVRHGYFRIHWIDVDPSSHQPVEADFIISSGSLIRASAFKTIGLMREDLFIDRVDTEWGLRAKHIGFKSFVVPNVLMTHRVGETSVKFQNKWLYFHNDARHYYIVRNSTYLLQLKTMGWAWRCENLFNEIPKNCLKYFLFSDHKLRTFGLLLRALLDGMRGKLGRIDDGL
jgi:rhamnosyltransferase